MKNLQASYNEDTIKIIKHAQQEIKVRENLNFLINLATIAIVTEDKTTAEVELSNFNKAWNHPDKSCKENGMRPKEKNLET